MARKKKHPEHVNHERWLISYADFITLLFAFFVVMFAVSQVDSKKMGRFTESFTKAMGIDPIGTGHQGSLISAGEAEVGGKGDPNEAEERIGGGPGELQSLKDALEKYSKESEALKNLQIIKRRNELVLRIPVGVVFDSGDDNVKPSALAAILAITAELRKRPVEIRVEGHSDNRPIHTDRFRSNWDLSACRAAAVVMEIAKVTGMGPERLSAAGYGEFHPIATNGTAEGRAQNRRVDLVVRVMDTRPDEKADPTPLPKPENKAEGKAEEEPKEDAKEAKGEDAKPGDAKHEEAKPGDAKGEDAKPGDAKHEEAKPAPTSAPSSAVKAILDEIPGPAKEPAAPKPAPHEAPKHDPASAPSAAPKVETKPGGHEGKH
ncbi:MAG: OmpA family protein [Polyangiaceae bacterium]|nr:OmpA family protein [Polyangiaceae bacterium]